MDTKQPLIVIVGPTASGKTASAIKVAKKVNGEIICADSRTIYKEMDIGTAKPTLEEQEGIKHWGIDLVAPNERFTVTDFKAYAEAKIDDIRKRGKVPFLVGGTGLYVDSVVFDFSFTQRAQNGNWRSNPRNDTIEVGIATQRDELRARIVHRAEQLFSNGVVSETTKLGKKYGWNLPAMTGNVYPIVHAYLKDEYSLETAIEKFTTQDWQLAKRQMTWFRPNPYIEWCDLTGVEDYIISRIASE